MIRKSSCPWSVTTCWNGDSMSYPRKPNTNNSNTISTVGFFVLDTSQKKSEPDSIPSDKLTYGKCSIKIDDVPTKHLVIFREKSPCRVDLRFFLFAARLNHSCLPNCQVQIEVRMMKMGIFTHVWTKATLIFLYLCYSEIVYCKYK